MALMTLVANPVRHSVDPGLDGGRTELCISQAEGRCHIHVSDTGLGLQPGSTGPGVGLRSLRERVKPTLSGDAAMRVGELSPRGFAVSIECPVWP